MNGNQLHSDMAMMKPKVSIIIPCYNHEKYIWSCLDSVLSDTYCNKEIVIIDDGSKDRSSEVISKWIIENGSEIEIQFITRENRGLCATLNELINISNGEYIVLLASDDALCNNTISQRVSVLENNQLKSVLISDAEGIDGNGFVIYNSVMVDFHKVKKFKYNTDEGILDQVIFNFAISGAVIMVKKNFYKIIGPYPIDLKAEDLYFYILAASLREIVFFDQIVSKYRIHDSNTSGYNPELTKTVIKTYFRTIGRVPGVFRRLRILKRIVGLLLIK